MKKKYRSMYCSQIVKFFPNCVPCRCFEDRNMITEPIPYYTVTLTLGEASKDGSREIISLLVECQNCESAKEYDVRKYHVKDTDIDW